VGYNENLEIAFEYVTELLNEVDGRVIISADHGNMIGERQGPLPTKRHYGHPWGVYTTELVNVPWHVIDDGERREVLKEPPATVGKKGQPDELVEQRLQTLGYG
jgi:hypothetical protein